jgi:RND family efflux transporter MFP subunit
MNKGSNGHYDVVFHLIGVAIVAAAITGGVALASSRRQAVAREADARVEALRAGPLVETAAVKPAPPGRTVTLTGEVHAFRQTTLFAKVSGYLKLVRVDKGDRVKAGDVLGVIEAPEVEQDVASKQADVAIKKLTEARLKALVKSGVVSQQEMDRAAADVNIANAELARLSALRGYEVIRAPFAGIVTARHADQGALLQAATASQAALPLVDVADISRVRVYVYLAQSEALFVREGDAAIVWAEERPDRRVTATVTRLAKQLDPRTRTMLTEVDIENQTGKDGAPLFYPGTFVHVSLTLATPPSLMLPAQALVMRAGKPFVATVKDGHAVFVAVAIGDTDGQFVRVQSGVGPGDEVVLHPGDDVVDGAVVRVAPRTAG